jgi:hypothetical protein
MATDPRRVCEHCGHWQRLENNPSQGECRRYAPRPMTAESLHMMNFWPVTNAHDWCGEFAPVAHRPE